MKVLIIAMRAFALSRSRTGLIQHLQNQGWEVVAVCEGGAGEEDLRRIGVKVHTIAFHSNPKNLTGIRLMGQKLREVVKEERPDFVHVFNALPIMLAGPSFFGIRPSVVLNTVTGLGRGYGGGGLAELVAMWGYGFSLTRANYSVCQNNSDSSILWSRFPWLKKKMGIIIGSGVDTNIFKPKQMEKQKQAPIVLMVSRLMWSKGVKDFVEMARKVKSEFPEVRFQLGGEIVDGDPDGVPEDWLRSQVDEGTIEYLGYISNLETILPTVDLVVHPTMYREGVPRIVMEAGACGIPIVTTTGPGNDDVVIDGVTGVLFEGGDLDGLSKSVANLLLDSGQRLQMGASARKHICDNFDIEIINKTYLALYKRLISENQVKEGME